MAGKRSTSSRGLGTYRKVPDAMNALEAAFGRFGFETIIVTGLPNPDQRFAQMVLAKRWPAGWFSLYTENNYDRVDPVVRLCRQSVNPFEWSEAPYDAELEPSAAEVMNRAGDFRMSRGFIVPIHGLTGYEAAVSLGGVHLDLNPRSKPALHLMAMYGFDHIRRLLDPAPHPSARLHPARARGDRLGLAGQVGLGDRRDPAHHAAHRRRASCNRRAQARRRQPYACGCTGDSQQRVINP